MNNTPCYDLVVKYSSQINENLNGYIKGYEQWNWYNHKCYCFVYKFINFDNAISVADIAANPNHYSDIVVTNKVVVDILNATLNTPNTANYHQLREMILHRDLLTKILESIPESFDTRPRFKCFYFKFVHEFKKDYLLISGANATMSEEQLCNNYIISKVRTNSFNSPL